MGVRRPYLVSMYLQSSTLWGKYKESIKKVKNSLNSLWSSIECTVTFRMTAIPIPRQVIDGDAVQADSRCTCIFQSSCEWYFINFVGKFENLIGYAIWAAAVMNKRMRLILYYSQRSLKQFNLVLRLQFIALKDVSAFTNLRTWFSATSAKIWILEVGHPGIWSRDINFWGTVLGIYLHLLRKILFFNLMSRTY